MKAVGGLLWQAAYCGAVVLFCVLNTMLTCAAWVRNCIVPRLRAKVDVAPLRPAGDPASWRISVVVPCFNEAERVGPTIRGCVAAAAQPSLLDIVVVESAGTTDGTLAAAADTLRSLQCRHVLLRAGSGRGAPHRAGGMRAEGDVIVFLHADVVLPSDWDSSLRSALAQNTTAICGSFRFGVAKDAPDRAATLPLRASRWLYGWRVRMLGCMEGDHGPFATRAAYRAMDGHPDWPLMEDVEFQRRAWWLAGSTGSQVCVVAAETQCSPRKWSRGGVLKTTVTNTAVYAAFWSGAAGPKELYQWYYGRPFVPAGRTEEL